MTVASSIAHSRRRLSHRLCATSLIVSFGLLVACGSSASTSIEVLPGDNEAGGSGGAGGSAGASGAGGSAGDAGSGGGGSGGSGGSAGDSGSAGSGDAGSNSGGSAGSGDAGSSNGGSAGSGDAGSGPTSPGMIGDDCSAMAPCGEALVCAAGKCVEGEGPCESDADCQGDTYCCAAGCSTGPAQCIAYGTGPRAEVSPTCEGEPIIGIFDPREQCAWTAPPAGDPYPGHINVLGTPMVANLPYDSGAAAEIVFVSYNYTDGGLEASQGTDPAYFGVIRVINGQTCQQLASIADSEFPLISSPPIAIGDLDGDKVPEIVALTVNGGVSAFRWSADSNTYTRYWHANPPLATSHWDGPSLHDLNDDGYAEVIMNRSVFDGRTGELLNKTTFGVGGGGSGVIPVLADVDGDGRIDLVDRSVLSWDKATNEWVTAFPGSGRGYHFAVADFGTPGTGGAPFDPSTPDGIAEIVTVGDSLVTIHTLNGTLLLSAATEGGGPPTVGDFDGDGRPEVAVAGGQTYAVFDLDCLAPNTPGCLSTGVRWRTASQDSSSATTGSSIFDFDGDGRAEAVYADECFTRVYDGSSGEVLYSSYRTSCTWYENPVVADPDQDQNTEIIVPSNTNCAVACPAIDPIHRGQRCETEKDCGGGACDEGFCRCTTDEQCGADAACVAPPAGTPGTGNTCRATHPKDAQQSGVRVLRDALDRWVSSRPLWNQHAYSVTNVEDDGSIPKTSAWKQSFALGSANNYRQNRQGTAGVTDLPDITGKLTTNKVCRNVDGGVELSATVCNRGKRAVGAAMPATFYDDTGAVLCTSYTSGPVPVGGCLEVTCQVPGSVSGMVTMQVNDDGKGGRTTIECIESNNLDTVNIGICKD